jgi:hypothetical protein
MLAAYQKIYEVYNNFPAARVNNYSIYQLSNDLICWKKTSGSQNLLVLVNVRNTTINVSLPPALTGTFLNLISAQNETVGSAVQLTPYAYRIYQMN